MCRADRKTNIRRHNDRGSWSQLDAESTAEKGEVYFGFTTW